MSAAWSCSTCARSAGDAFATSRPPSVVRSSRRSGTSVTTSGTTLQAMAIISSVDAISRLNVARKRRTQALDVVVADVPAVLAQVRRDAVRARVEAHARGLDRIRVRRAARVAERGHVIDVDVQTHHEPDGSTEAACAIRPGNRASFDRFDATLSRDRSTWRFMKPFPNRPPATVAALNPLRRAAMNLVMISLAKTSRCAAALALVMGVAAAGCSSSTGNTGNGTSGTSGTSGSAGSAQCKTGTEAPYANPAGTALTLPAGITVEGDISSDVDVHCADKTAIENASDLDLACVGLRNATGAEVVVTFPAGLTFVAKTPTTQNGMIIHSHDLTVPANALKYFYFRPASLNQACDATGTKDAYTLGNVTTDPKLVEILTLAKNKKVDGDVGAEVVGRMIWDVTDGNGVTDEHRTQLMMAPDSISRRAAHAHRSACRSHADTSFASLSRSACRSHADTSFASLSRLRRRLRRLLRSSGSGGSRRSGRPCGR